MNRTWFALVPALAAGVLAALPDGADGCAAISRHNQDVYTADEAALIVWDDATKTEHFVRRASFRSTGYDFGFLVPTPNKPELDVANDDLFGELAAITAPKVEYREVVKEVEKDFLPGCAPKSAADAQLAEKMPTSKAADRPGGVEVLEQKRVGDYDATVLAFRKGAGDTAETGAAELEKWLARHGYEAPPFVKEWLKKYVADQWCITAFKIASPEPKKGASKKDDPTPPAAQTARRDLRAKPIRMSFKADRPFYPYREPQTEASAPRGESRLLRVFFAAKNRYAGKLGDGAKPWPGQTVWVGPVDTGRWNGVYFHVEPLGGKNDNPRMNLPDEAFGYWLTEFEDRSSPRPGTDEVYFEPAADQTPVERPPNIVTKTLIVRVTPWWHIAVFIGFPTALVVIGLVTWRVLRRA
jgi:hypothetical protein